MKKQFKYPKSFEEQKKIPKITQKRIKLAEASLGDFEGRLENDLLNWFSLTRTAPDWSTTARCMPSSGVKRNSSPPNSDPSITSKFR